MPKALIHHAMHCKARSDKEDRQSLQLTLCDMQHPPGRARDTCREAASEAIRGRAVPDMNGDLPDTEYALLRPKPDNGAVPRPDMWDEALRKCSFFGQGVPAMAEKDGCSGGGSGEFVVTSSSFGRSTLVDTRSTPICRVHPHRAPTLERGTHRGRFHDKFKADE